MKNYTAIVADLRAREAGSIRRLGSTTAGTAEEAEAKENLSIIEDAIKRNLAEAEAELVRLTS